MGTSRVANTTKVKTTVPHEQGTPNDREPGEAVTVPVRQPCKTKLTPGMPDPSSEDVTFPVMLLSCKGKKPHKANISSENIKIGFINKYLREDLWNLWPDLI